MLQLFLVRIYDVISLKADKKKALSVFSEGGILFFGGIGGFAPDVDGFKFLSL